jgi:hypothetical protein
MTRAEFVAALKENADKFDQYWKVKQNGTADPFAYPEVLDPGRVGREVRGFSGRCSITNNEAQREKDRNMGSGLMVAPAGKTWKENPNSKQLDRPRSELSHSNQKSTCVSKGIDGGGGNDDKRMLFGGKSSEELWGKQKRTYAQPTPRADKAPSDK